MNDVGVIRIVVPLGIVKKYFPSLYKHPRIYFYTQSILKHAQDFFRILYFWLFPLVAIAMVVYFVIPAQYISSRSYLQSILLFIISMLLLCVSCLLIIESYGKETIRDAFVLKRFLLDRALVKKKLNEISNFNFDVAIPILAIKRFKPDDDCVSWLTFLPKKVASYDKAIQRLSVNYKINKLTVLTADSTYKNWTFVVMKDNCEIPIFGKALEHLWFSLLTFEIKMLENQKKS